MPNKYKPQYPIIERKCYGLECNSLKKACVGYLELASYMLYLVIRRQNITRFSPCSSYTLTLLPAQLPPKIKFALEVENRPWAFMVSGKEIWNFFPSLSLDLLID